MRAIIPCGRRAWFDLRNRTACDHNDAYPGRKARPFLPCILQRLSIPVEECEGGPLTGDLVLGVLLAVLALAVGSAGLGNVDLRTIVSINVREFFFHSLVRVYGCDTSERSSCSGLERRIGIMWRGDLTQHSAGEGFGSCDASLGVYWRGYPYAAQH